MRPINGSLQRDQVQYHRNRGDAPWFDVAQPGRIDLTRMFIEKILMADPGRPFRIVELGCGAGDVSGPYSGEEVYRYPRGIIDCAPIEVVGIDVTAGAKEAVARRFTQMRFIDSPVESLEPIDCDLLVMTEFLEHVADPVAIARSWMGQARWALIGHPLDEPDPGYEHGHAWSYTEEDWVDWFHRVDFHIWEKVVYPMGHWERMILGHGSRNG